MEKVREFLVMTMLRMLSSLSHDDNCKNNFLVIDEGDTFGINGSFGAPVLILVKQRKKIA